MWENIVATIPIKRVNRDGIKRKGDKIEMAYEACGRTDSSQAHNIFPNCCLVCKINVP